MKLKLLALIAFVAINLLGKTSDAQVIFYVEAPANNIGSYNFTYSFTSQWGGDLMITQVQAPVVLLRDANVADSLGCSAAANGSLIAGNIAMLYRGDCEFGMKALNAENAGAVGVIIINNIPGEPVGMGIGAVGAQVTIPVVMISEANGALLRAAVDAGTLEVFMGNKTGYYQDDLGFYKKDVVLARNYSTPEYVASHANHFEIPLGGFVFNFGTNNAIGVRLSAEVTSGTNVVYSESASASVNIISGDSAFFTLPKFTLPPGTNVGHYTVKYSIVSDGANDEFPDDNELTTGFYIHESYLTKSSLDQSGMPGQTSGTRPGGGAAQYTWCLIIDEKDATKNMEVNAIGFNLVSNNNFSLLNLPVSVDLFHWDDQTNGTSIDDNQLLLLSDGFYDYVADLQGEHVYAELTDVIQLEANKKYLACVNINGADVFMGVDNSLDYKTTRLENKNEFYYPLLSSQWFIGGFGTGTVPAIVVRTAENTVGIEEVKAERNAIVPYPNPAQYNINIPLNGLQAGMVDLQVFDLSGRIVRSEKVNVSNSKMFTVNTSDIESGAYFFRLQFEDKSVSSFPVVISK
ncbi:MAG: T9SS type A sorting domain-containing protein [Bacteroidetes bacterium]|nr:T9SS type A sorting domain-containing protein [Bacteroidota bacterium]